MFNNVVRSTVGNSYKKILKPLLFCIKPEIVHENMTGFGELLATSSIIKKITSKILAQKYPELEQTINGIHFEAPVGLSAGFDYDARLTQITSVLGFGFHTVGTITRLPYSGNPGPMLGRLPRSRSLMVNKGFKNRGAEQIVSKLINKNFAIPIGVSIGRTNTTQLTTHRECITDIISTFILFENPLLNHSYYELNISCPNLLTPITFYDPVQLDLLLKSIEVLKLQRPLFIKMPIECTNDVTSDLLDIIAKYSVQGVIFGNLQKNRNDPSLDPIEVAKFSKGNFSGKPTEQRSNELIALTYQKYKDRFTIIGTGGIFSAEDAYRKIKLGANVVQLITGMIYNGPQLISEINQGLVVLLQKDGYSHISQAIGTERHK